MWIAEIGRSYQKIFLKPSMAQPLKVNFEVVSRKLGITNRGTMLPPSADMISTRIVPNPLSCSCDRHKEASTRPKAAAAEAVCTFKHVDLPGEGDATC